ncbi:MAG: ABC transporter permease subunit [Planctomycetota bacterium]
MTERDRSFRRNRELHTRRSTAFADGVARWVIALGGIGTIAAVSTVFVFLFWVVKDLFLPARVGEPVRVERQSAGPILMAGVDEYRTTVWTISGDGRLELRLATDGTPLRTVALVEPGRAELTAIGREAGSSKLVLGFRDGSIQLVQVDFRTQFLEPERVESKYLALKPGEIAAFGESALERTVRGKFRVQSLQLRLEAPQSFGSGAPMVAVQRGARDDDVNVAGITAEGEVIVRTQVRTIDLFTDEVVAEQWTERRLVPIDTTRGRPRFVQIVDLGANLIVAWTNGALERWSLGGSEPRLAESLDLAPNDRVELSTLEVLLGGSTLIAGFSDGRVQGWFAAPSDSNDVDGFALVMAHDFRLEPASRIVSAATSSRQRVFVVGTEDGHVHALHMTSEKRIASIEVRGREAVGVVAIAPKGDLLLTVTNRTMALRDFDPRHAEASFQTLFGRTWFERENRPKYSWQSSAGSDAFEPKLSLMPLVFGTLKATFYSLLLAIPLALLAAVFTSEFLSARARSRIKPVVELMASLPSVVLGFLAANVIAPAAEIAVPTILTALFTVPLSVLFFAHLWQMLSLDYTLRRRWLQLPLTFLAMLGGVLLAMVIAPQFESALFGGSLRMWLVGTSAAVADGRPGWFVLLLPVAAVSVGWLVKTRLDPVLLRRTAEFPHTRAGAVHLAKFVGAVVATLVLAWVGAHVLFELPRWFAGSETGFDLRGGIHVGQADLSPIGAFDQRNSLIVGFVMGFAIVPIIYTLAEDALASVPDHLRAASLGAGATPWQTASRVVVPTAMSGLFSACMVGLGRAVGETMIVLMAAGGTAIMDMNVFAGFRTLSANIATELPEAARNSTHYVTLFLAALVLFAMTFVINTFAESVRQRFRRRAYQL